MLCCGVWRGVAWRGVAWRVGYNGKQGERVERKERDADTETEEDGLVDRAFEVLCIGYKCVCACVCVCVCVFVCVCARVRVCV